MEPSAIDTAMVAQDENDDLEIVVPDTDYDPEMHIAARSRPPGGYRITQTQYEERMEFVEKLLLECAHRYEIDRKCLRRFGMRPRTAHEYMARVRKQWADESAEGRAVEREKFDAQLREKIRLVTDKDAFGAMANLLRLRADILGLRSDAINIAVQANATAQAAAHAESGDNLSDEELEAIQRYHEARDKRLGPGGGK